MVVGSSELKAFVFEPVASPGRRKRRKAGGAQRDDLLKLWASPSRLRARGKRQGGRRGEVSDPEGGGMRADTPFPPPL